MSERETVVVDPLGGLLLDPPNELKFKGPFDDYVSVSLSIRNPTEKKIAFKIKTTAPKRYCVKPNSGVLDPSQSMKVNDHARAGQPVNTTATSLDDGKVIANESTSKPSSGRSNTSSSTTSNTSSSKDTYVNANDMSTANDFDSTAVSIKPSSQYTSNQKNTTTPAAAVAANTNNNNNSTTSSTAASRLEKNDNTLNELKQLKQENDSLKKEVARLKEEEARLRKLALQAPSSNQNRPQNDQLADVLNNRSTLIIILLIAIILYLLLFR